MVHVYMIHHYHHVYVKRIGQVLIVMYLFAKSHALPPMVHALHQIHVLVILVILVCDFTSLSLPFLAAYLFTLVCNNRIAM
jgi:hypothetical protein